MSPLKRSQFRIFSRRLVAAAASVGLLLSTFCVAPVLADDGSSKDSSAKAADTSTKSDSKDGVNRDAWRKLQTMMNRRAMDKRGPGARPNARGEWRGRYRTQMAYGYHRRSPAGPAWAHYQHRHHGAQFARYHRHHGQQFARNHRSGPQWARNTYRHGSAWARMNFGRGHGPARFAQARYHSRHGRSAWARNDNHSRSNHHRGGQQFARHNHRGHNGRGMGPGGPQFAWRGGPRGNFGQGGGFGPRGYLAQRGFAPRGGFGFADGHFGQGFGPGFGGGPGQRGFGPGPGAAFGQRGFGSGPGPRFADRNFGPPNGRMAGFNRDRDGAQDVSKLEARIDGLEHRIDALLDQLGKLQQAPAQK